MTVAVSGVAGHIGANLVRALLAQGRPVHTPLRETIIDTLRWFEDTGRLAHPLSPAKKKV